MGFRFRLKAVILKTGCEILGKLGKVRKYENNFHSINQGDVLVLSSEERPARFSDVHFENTYLFQGMISFEVEVTIPFSSLIK